MSELPPMRPVKPGWYPDPQTPNMQRYWEGEWTEHVAPGMPPRASGGDAGVSVSKIVWGILIAAVIIGIAGYLINDYNSYQKQQDQLACVTRNAEKAANGTGFLENCDQ